MKKFLLGVTLFLILLNVINFMLYLAGKRLYFGTYSHHSLKYKSYLLSDSHGEAIANFGERYGVYNFSVGSDSYFDMYRKAYYLVKKNAADTIYISADDYTLSPYREKRNNLDRSVAYTSPEQFSNYYQYLKAKYLKRYIILFQPKVAAVLKTYLISKTEEILNGGNSASINKNWQSMTVAERINMSELRTEEQFQYSEPSQELKRSLLDIIKLCKDNNVVLIGVKFPVASEYLKILKEKNFGADSLMRSKGIKVLDFTKAYVNYSDYFANQDHLNSRGAKNFAELLFAPKNKM